MNPAFSVIFLTTLIGLGQGLYLFLVITKAVTHDTPQQFFLVGALVSVGLLMAGLIASFFHLGRPERAWRAISKWKTSWLSREVIILPATMLTILIYGGLHWQPFASQSMIGYLGWIGVFLTILLFVCTAMIYACIKFLQEWASPLTVLNFILLGCLSGGLAGLALLEFFSSKTVLLLNYYVLTLFIIALIGKLAAFFRNARIKHRSNIQSAIGIKHRKITQRSMGFSGGSFNTRAFFHHCSSKLIANMRLVVLAMVFVIPFLFFLAFLLNTNTAMLIIALTIQYLGLVAERWLFFTQANHPQNLYYQTVG